MYGWKNKSLGCSIPNSFIHHNVYHSSQKCFYLKRIGLNWIRKQVNETNAEYFNSWWWNSFQWLHDIFCLDWNCHGFDFINATYAKMCAFSASIFLCSFCQHFANNWISQVLLVFCETTHLKNIKYCKANIVFKLSYKMNEKKICLYCKKEIRFDVGGFCSERCKEADFAFEVCYATSSMKRK